MIHSKLFGPQFVLVVTIVLSIWPLPANAHKIGKGYNNGPIWEIKTESNSVYLLGSIHALNAAYYPLTRAFYYAYYDSPTIVFEIDLNKVLAANRSSLLKRKHAFATSQRAWDTLLLQLDFSGEYGIDRHFYWKARAAGKRILWLERFDYHRNILDEILVKNHSVMKRGPHTKSKHAAQRINRLIEAWHQGDEDTLHQLIEEEKTISTVYQTVYLERNKKWLEKIESFIGQKENYLVIVGVGHLVGEEGLVNLLKKKGHSIRRMVYAIP